MAPHFVECGCRKFADGKLQFFASIAKAIAERRPNLVLVSGVLRYLEDLGQ